MSREALYTELYKKYATDLTDEQIAEKVKYASSAPDQQAAITTIYEKYAGKEPTFDQRLYISKRVDPQSVNSIIATENAKRKKQYDEEYAKYEQLKKETEAENKRLADEVADIKTARDFDWDKNVTKEYKLYNPKTEKFEYYDFDELPEAKQRGIKRHGQAYRVSKNEDYLVPGSDEEATYNNRLEHATKLKLEAEKRIKGNLGSLITADQGDVKGGIQLVDAPGWFTGNINSLVSFDDNGKLTEEGLQILAANNELYDENGEPDPNQLSAEQIEQAQVDFEELKALNWDINNDIAEEVSISRIDDPLDTIKDTKKRIEDATKQYEDVKDQIDTFDYENPDNPTENDLKQLKTLQSKLEQAEFNMKEPERQDFENEEEFKAYQDFMNLDGAGDRAAEIRKRLFEKAMSEGGADSLATFSPYIKNYINTYGEDKLEERLDLLSKGKSQYTQGVGSLWNKAEAATIAGIENIITDEELDYFKTTFGIEDEAEIIQLISDGIGSQNWNKALSGKKNQVGQDLNKILETKGYVQNTWNDGWQKAINNSTDDTFLGQDLAVMKATDAGKDQAKEYLGDMNEMANLSDEQKLEKTDIAMQEWIGSDYVVKDLINEYAKDSIPKLKKYKESLLSSGKYDITNDEDVEKINDLMRSKQNELTVGAMTQDLRFQKRVSQIGLAVGEVAAEYDVAFGRADSKWLSMVDFIAGGEDDMLPFNDSLASFLEGVGSGVEGIKVSIADKAKGSWHGNQLRKSKDRVNALNKAIEEGLSPDTPVYYDTKLGKYVESKNKSDKRMTIKQRLDGYKEDVSYHQAEVVEQIEDMMESEEYLSLFKQANFDDGISFEDIFLTVGQAAPHIGMATAGTVAAAFTGGTSLAAVAPLLTYAGTAMMGLQMYGDNYWGAIEQNLADKGLDKESLARKFPDATKAEIDEMYKKEAIANLESGEGANMASSAAFAAAQTLLESYGANQIVEGTIDALKGVKGAQGLTMNSLFKTSWDDTGKWLLRGAIEKGGNALEEFGTEYMQEILGQVSAATQSGRSYDALIDTRASLQAGIGGAITGFVLPFSGQIATQTKREIRNIASDMAVRYRPGSNRAQAALKLEQWFKDSTKELQDKYPNRETDAEQKKKYYEELNTLNNVRTANQQLFGQDYLANMSDDQYANLLNTQVDINTYDAEIEKARKEKNKPLEKALREEQSTLIDFQTEIIKAERTTGRVQKILSDMGKSGDMIVVEDDAALRRQAKKENIALDDDNLTVGFYTNDGKIVMNKKMAALVKEGNTAAHELLHKVLFNTLYEVDGEGNIQGKNVARGLAASLDDQLSKLDPKDFGDSKFARKLELYKKDPAAIKAEEKIVLFADALESGDIKFNENIFTKIGDQIRRFLQAAGLRDVKFNSGRDVYNFLKDYNASVKKGKLNQAQIKMMEEGAEVGKDIRRFQGSEGNLGKAPSKANLQGVSFIDDQIEQNREIGNRILRAKNQKQLEARKKKILDLETQNSAEELRAMLKDAKGENKQDIELALQEKFKKLPQAVKDSGIDIYTGKSNKALNDLVSDYKQELEKNPKANPNKELKGQYTAASLDALNRWAAKRGVPLNLYTKEGRLTEQGREALSAINNQFSDIMRTYKPVVNGKKVSLTTYLDKAIGPRVGTALVEEATRKGKQVSQDALNEKGVSLETTKQKDFDAKEQKDTSRKKKYPSSLKSVRENIPTESKKALVGSVDEAGRATGAAKTIIQGVGKNISSEGVAKDIIASTKDKSVMQQMRKDVGKFNSDSYNQFVDNVVDEGLTKTIPAATIKRRLGRKANVKSGLIDYEQTGTTPTINITKEGKKSYFDKPVYKINKIDNAKLKEYYKAGEKRQQSLFSMLAEGAIVEGISDLKNDQAFVNKLGDTLELKNKEFKNELNKLEQELKQKNLESQEVAKKIKTLKDNLTKDYLDNLTNQLDQRTKEDTSLDIVKANKALKTEASKVEQAKNYKERGLAKDARTKMSNMKGVKYITPTFKRGDTITYKKIRTRKYTKKDGTVILPYAKTVTESYGKTPTYVKIETSPEAIRTRRINTIAMRSKMGEEAMNSLASHNKAFYQFKKANKDTIHSVDNDINYKFDENNKADKADLDILRKQKIPLVKNKDGTFSLDLKKSKTIDIRVNKKGEIVKPDQKGYKEATSVLKVAANDQKNYTKWSEEEFRTKAKSKQFRKMQEAKIDMLENISKVIAKDIEANPENAGFWAQWLASQETGQSGHPIRTLAPIKFFSDIMKGPMRAEHTMPSNQIATLIFGMAQRNTVDTDFDVIKDNYFQGKITVEQDNKLGVNDDGVNLKSDMPQIFFNILNPKTWYRYVDKSVNKQDGGINMNTLLIYDENGKVQTVAQSLGVGLTKAQYTMADGTVNQNLIQEQNNMIYDMFEKNMDPKDVKDKLTAKYNLNTQIKKTQRVKANKTELAPTILNDKATTTAQKQTMINSFETRAKANKVIGKKAKGISVFDFDDTLAKTKEKVIVNNADGTTTEISASEFAKQADVLTEAGATFDFTNFENVSLDTAEGPLADLARKRQGKFGSKNIFVLTARPQISATAIKSFLDSIGINIPLENITGLEDGSPQAKVDWVLNKTAEGYNDFYFADDSFANVEGVKQVLDAVDVKNKVQVAKANKVKNLDKDFNKILEEVTGKEAYKTYSKARATLEGKQRDKGFLKRIQRQFSITSSADDFKGLTYAFRGKGEQGNRHAQFIQENLIDPYDKAELELLKAKTTVANDFAELKKQFPSLKSKRVFGFKTENPLLNEIGVGPYTKSHAIRVYLWNKQGMEIPGMSKKDINALVKAVESDNELNVFADEVQLIQKDSQYPPPGKNWLAGDIKSDIVNGLDTVYREKLLTEWNENVNEIFSEKNLNKLEALYGTKYVEALKDSIARQRAGTNRHNYTGPGSRVVNEMLDWLNSAVGVTMFFNRKSGLLQTLSTVNFINWGDNNIYAAAKAFASKEYWPTFVRLLNSDYLTNRRDGLKINVNEAELANAAKDGGFKGLVNYLLDKGFVITRIMDSLAIATGGTTFFINRKKSLLNRINPETGKLYTEAEADEKAFLDFYQVSEETQQSSNPSKISSQQASIAGRLLLSFQNVTMQFNRNTKRAILDFVNRRKKPGFTQRESDLSNMSSVVYYVGMQNLIFNSLQQGLFTMLFDEEDEKEKEKYASTINGMVDSLLFGLGFGGAIVSTLKNLAIRINEENKKADKGLATDYQDIGWDIFDVSPVLDSKIRKIRTAAKTFDWNKEEMARRGWSLDNPAYLAYAQLISAATNLPVDRALVLMNSLRQATDENTRLYQRIALALGWSGWSLDLPYWGRESTTKREAEEDERLKEKYKLDVAKVKKQGFTKRVPFTGPNSWKDGVPKNLKLGIDYVQLERPDGLIQYYKKP